ncbi:MAG: type IV-A pilus assembly ATPase PilB, partial [Methylomonas sp.]
MATAPSNINFSGLAKCLIQKGLLTEEIAATCLQEAQKNKQHLVAYLVNRQYIDSKTIASVASVEFGVPFFDLDAIDISSLPIKLVSEKLIRQHHALPLFKRGNRLFVATSDPTNFQALDEIKFHTRHTTENILVEEDKLIKMIDAALEAADTSMNTLLDEDLDNIDISSGDEKPVEETGGSDIDDAPIVRFVNKILLDSIKKGVSDIHMEPFEKKFRIRFRADGILSEIASPPVGISSRIISRIKVMSKMDIAERRVPQDGRIKMQISKNRAIDFRVNTCPTLFGEKVVLRILDPTSAQIGIERLGFEPIQQKQFLEAINKPYGMVLVTGPTGSGKTVSLYTGLNLLNSIERNISTAEDPVEITVEGINQVNVNPKAGLTFAEALRAFLRQDPDVIMVGEIRDLETAEIAIRAALTGHLVFSTLHTNDAPSAFTRLIDMGIEPFLVASSVESVMAQRLVRTICSHCKVEQKVEHDYLRRIGFPADEIGTTKFWHGVGCEECRQLGYLGRMGIYELLILNESLR